MLLLLVGVGTMGKPYLRAAAELGIDVRVVETEDWQDEPSAGHALFRIPTPHAHTGQTDEAWAAGAYRAAVSASRPDGVLAFAEPHVLAAALVQDRLGLAGPSLHAAILSRNKALQRACLAAVGVRQPEFALCGDVDDAMSWAGDRLPVMVKSLSSAGSDGVELVDDPARLRAVVEDVRGSERVLVETAVEGPEYSWEGFIRRGDILFGNVTAKETSGPPQFVELAHRCGHEFTDDEQVDQVTALVTNVVRAMAIDTGQVHLEFRMTADGPAVMETAVRTPGDFLLDLIASAYGFDPYRVVVQLAMGLPVELPANPAPTSFAAVAFFSCDVGEVVSVSGMDDIRRQRWVAEAKLAIRPGSRVHQLLSSGQRIGFVRVIAPTPEERDEAIATARSTLRVRLA